MPVPARTTTQSPDPAQGSIASDRAIELTAYNTAWEAARAASADNKLSAMVAAVQAYAEQVWAEVRQKSETAAVLSAAGQAPIACGAGCAWCCHQHVAIAPPEAVAIARHVERRFTPEQRAALEERIKALDTVTRGATVAERARLKQPCAFLVEGACSIYEARPLRCRRVHSRDAGYCRWTMENPDEAAALRKQRTGPGPYVVPSARIMDSALRGLARACRDHGVSVETLELTAAARIALSVPEVEQHVLNGEPVFAAALLAEADGEPPAKT